MDGLEGECADRRDDAEEHDADGKAGFKLGGKEVTGGGAEIDESAKTLTISLFGISNTWKIDQPPSGNSMILSGTRYTKN